MKTVERFLSYLELRLSPRRFQHSLGVMQTMEKLADIYDLNIEQATTAGLLHDIAKELKPEQYEKIVNEARIEIRCKEDENYHLYLHGPVGAHLAENELGIEDFTILKAIETHTFYGVYDEHFKTPLNWCLHFSDIIEPTRVWSQVEWLQTNATKLTQTVYSGALEESISFFTGGIIEWFTNDKMPIHPNIYRAHDEHAKKIS